MMLTSCLAGCKRTLTVGGPRSSASSRNRIVWNRTLVSAKHASPCCCRTIARAISMNASSNSENLCSHTSSSAERSQRTPRNGIGTAAERVPAAACVSCLAQPKCRRLSARSCGDVMQTGSEACLQFKTACAIVPLYPG
eukprot:scaffold119109_cov68-Phaeocystis_antarctica.AAC.9